MKKGFVACVLALCLALVACASSARYEEKLNVWIGASEKALVTSWGVPDKQYALDDETKLLSYVDEDQVTYSGAAPTCTTRTTGSTAVTQCLNALSPESMLLRCETTFTLVKGVVRKWSYRGNACRTM